MSSSSTTLDNHNFKPSRQISKFELDQKPDSNSQEESLISTEWNDSKEFRFKPNQTSSVYDVAEFILKTKGEMTTMKLHKLVYYCQAWSLVWDERPIFQENIEAWANGPVIRDLFSFHKGKYFLSSVSTGNPDLLDESQKETINSVLEFYGSKPAQWLIELTHLEAPWKNARVGLSATERGDSLISFESIAEYYSSL